MTRSEEEVEAMKLRAERDRELLERFDKLREERKKEYFATLRKALDEGRTEDVDFPKLREELY